MRKADRLITVGGEAPDFLLPSIMGEDMRLSDFRGRHHVVLVFLRGFF